ACSDCGTSLAEITPRLFSFNSPYGACPTCSGLGTIAGGDPEEVVPDPERSIDAGGIAPWPAGGRSWRMQMIETLAEALGFSLDTPWKKLPEAARRTLLHGTEEEMTFQMAGK